ncbi:MAG: hypothetical protein GC150_06915 [Rhizobiales bacterium]|nr:hypothetical protein [Hyphomicrobiales bacterium]
MTYYAFQTAIILLAVFLVGALIGLMLRLWFFPARQDALEAAADPRGRAYTPEARRLQRQQHDTARAGGVGEASAAVAAGAAVVAGTASALRDDGAIDRVSASTERSVSEVVARAQDGVEAAGAQARASLEQMESGLGGATPSRGVDEAPAPQAVVPSDRDVQMAEVDLATGRSAAAGGADVAGGAEEVDDMAHARALAAAADAARAAGAGVNQGAGPVIESRPTLSEVIPATIATVATVGGERSHEGIGGDDAAVALAAAAAAAAAMRPAANVLAADVSWIGDVPQVTPASGRTDDLTRIRGIDADTARRLAELGVTGFDQIAGLDAVQVDGLDRVFGHGRISREGWIEQAAVLERGGTTHFVRRRDLGALKIAEVEQGAAHAGSAPRGASVLAAAAAAAVARGFEGTPSVAEAESVATVESTAEITSFEDVREANGNEAPGWDVGPAPIPMPDEQDGDDDVAVDEEGSAGEPLDETHEPLRGHVVADADDDYDDEDEGDDEEDEDEDDEDDEDDDRDDEDEPDSDDDEEEDEDEDEDEDDDDDDHDDDDDDDEDDGVFRHRDRMRSNADDDLIREEVLQGADDDEDAEVVDEAIARIDSAEPDAAPIEDWRARTAGREEADLDATVEDEGTSGGTDISDTALAIAAAAAGSGVAVATQQGSASAGPAMAPGEDDLTLVAGIDAWTASMLGGHGITTYADIAGLEAEHVRALNAALGERGRVERQNWIEQAAVLARGGQTLYARRVLATRHQEAGAASPPADEAAMQSASAAAALAAAAAVAATSETADSSETRLKGAAREVLTEVEPALSSGAHVEPEDGEGGDDADRSGEAGAGRVRRNFAGLRSVRSEALRGEQGSGRRVIGQRAPSAPDDLKRIRGIGVVIERKLFQMGITQYRQIADFTEADIESISEQLDFKGRIERENWVGQARILAGGGITDFARRFDRGESEGR